MPLDSQSISSLRSTVNEACADPRTGIPGATVVVVGKDGEELFAHSAGKRGVCSNSPMTLDNIFWIASCTKMLAGVACMQLVEQGILKLDDGAQVESLCPEIKDLKVLRPDGTLEDKKTPITLRMLLSHTAGFGYSFFNERLRDWSFPAGLDEFSGRFEDIKSPLLFQPGTGWEYGVCYIPAPFRLRNFGFMLSEFVGRNRLGRRGSGASDPSHPECVPSEECTWTSWYQKHVHDSASGDEGEHGLHESPRERRGTQAQRSLT